MEIQPRPYGADTLVVGVDIAKSSHVAVFQSPDFVFSKPSTFANTRKGFEAFRDWIRAAAVKAGTAHVIVALEPTGHYWKPLGEFLQAEQLEIRMVSTVLTKRVKDMLDNSPLKTDAKDARVIADLARQGRSRPQYVQTTDVQELRYLVELRERFNREKTACLNRLHRLLDLLFPEILGMFSRIDCKSILALIEAAPTPAAAMQLGVAELAAVLERASNHYYGTAKALQILDAAQSSIGCKQGITPLVFEVLVVVPRIRDFDRLLLELEAEMAEVLNKIDYGPLLLTIPSFGVLTASVVVAELGDLRLYRNARQVLKMAGLNLFERSSGYHRGQRRITKRGRSLLRKILYLAVLRQAGEKGIFGEYFKKFGPDKPKPKIAVASMRRLLRIIFATVRDNKAFTPGLVAPAQTREMPVLKAA